MKKRNIKRTYGEISKEFSEFVKGIQRERIMLNLDPPTNPVGMKRITKAIALHKLMSNIKKDIIPLKREDKNE